MSQCEIARVLWFNLLGLHLQHFSFATPLDFLATVTFNSNLLGNVSNIETKYKIIVVAAIILKRTWEARCDVIFNNIMVDVNHIVTLAEQDLMMELSRHFQPFDDCSLLHPHHCLLPPCNCLKLNVDVGFKQGEAVMVVLAHDDSGKVKGL